MCVCVSEAVSVCSAQGGHHYYYRDEGIVSEEIKKGEIDVFQTETSE